ncbi:GntR family transcriptional regulator [Planktomarina temperata]|nr:GntR family transcriptional regulator [Planktomarina temperata]
MTRAKIAAPLRQEIAREMKSDLAAMVFKPGMRLIERELCERYEVSRTIVREVLRELESQGLVENILNVGPVVSTITPEEAVQIYEIRGNLIGLAARKFVQAATPKQVSKILRIFEQIKRAAARGDVTAVLSTVTKLHEALMSAINHKPLEEMLDRIHTRVAMLRVLTLSSEGRLTNTIEELTRIFDAIEAGDAVGAERAYIDHMNCVASVAGELLKKQQIEQPAPKPTKRQAVVT